MLGEVYENAFIYLRNLQSWFH